MTLSRTFTAAELANAIEAGGTKCAPALAKTILDGDEGFLARGLVVAVEGGYRLTPKGLGWSRLLPIQHEEAAA
jgi:hypothetical protein